MIVEKRKEARERDNLLLRGEENEKGRRREGKEGDWGLQGDDDTGMARRRGRRGEEKRRRRGRRKEAHGFSTMPSQCSTAAKALGTCTPHHSTCLIKKYTSLEIGANRNNLMIDTPNVQSHDTTKDSSSTVLIEPERSFADRTNNKHGVKYRARFYTMICGVPLCISIHAFSMPTLDWVL